MAVANFNKKLSYRRETARQLPTWRECGVRPSSPLPLRPLAIPMRMAESESHNVSTPIFATFLLPLSHSAPSLPMFPLEFCGEVKRAGN